MMNWQNFLTLAQLLGYAAFLIEIISFSLKHDQRQIYLRAVSSLVWFAHYFTLERLVPALIVGIDFFRYGSANHIKQNRKWAWLAVAVFSSAYLSIAFTLQKEPADLISGCISILSCVSVFILRGIPMRVGFLFIMTAWFIYNCYVHSYGGMLNDGVMVAVNAITIYRMLRDRKQADG